MSEQPTTPEAPEVVEPIVEPEPEVVVEPAESLEVEVVEPKPVVEQQLHGNADY